MEFKVDLENNILELEHAIGYSGKIVQSVYLHPNGKDFIYIAGGCIVICDLNDPHQQTFLRGHDNQITCLALSNTGNLLASGLFYLIFFFFHSLKK
jgi:WD40 repeat protein